MNPFIKSIASCALYLGLITSAIAQQTYSFAIVPQQAASQLAEVWAPVLDWLSKQSGIKLAFATAPDVPQFEQKLSRGEYDIAYMNPYHFVVFNKNPGYQALARASGERIKGLVVVRKDSPIKSIKELAGRELAFPTPAAFAASLLVQAGLRAQGIPFKPVIVKSHNSVYRDVAKGIYIAGGGVPRTLNLLDESVSSELRVLWETKEFTTHAIATRPDLDPKVTARLRLAMRAMSEDPQGRELLKAIGFSGFESAKNQDWDDIRQLKIRPEDAQLKMEP